MLGKFVPSIFISYCIHIVLYSPLPLKYWDIIWDTQKFSNNADCFLRNKMSGSLFSTVYVVFYDQPGNPRSQRSRSLNSKVVVKLSEFSFGSTTGWSLKPMQTTLRWVLRPPNLSTVAVLLHKGRNQRSLYPRSLLCSKGGPSTRFRSLYQDWPLNP